MNHESNGKSRVIGGRPCGNIPSDSSIAVSEIIDGLLDSSSQRIINVSGQDRASGGVSYLDEAVECIVLIGEHPVIGQIAIALNPIGIIPVVVGKSRGGG